MTKRKDYVSVVIILLMCLTTITGILSINFSHTHDFLNLYGETVKIYGYGIYAFDSYFMAPINIGTDICILFVLVPLFLYTYIQYRRTDDTITE
jgi:hypothetical protein